MSHKTTQDDDVSPKEEAAKPRTARVLVNIFSAKGEDDGSKESVELNERGGRMPRLKSRDKNLKTNNDQIQRNF